MWYHKLEFELETSDVMVLVVSEKVRTSKWVHNEVSMAEEIGKPVIPVLAEKIRLPLWMRHLQILDFCGARDWAVLLGALGYHVGVEQNPIGDPVADRYLIHNDGTVTDTATKLMWKRCSEGQYGENCKVEAQHYNWHDAMSTFGNGVSFASYNDWRMPTIEELCTLVDRSQKPTINLQAFPNTSMDNFWSASFNADNSANALSIDFSDGNCRECFKHYYTFQVRLVRSGQ